MRRTRHLKSREIQGCQLALDAAVQGSMFDAAAGGNVSSLGGVVARWEDRSGNGRHFSQATAALQPTLAASGVSFNGHRLGIGASALFRAYSTATVIVVASVSSVGASNAAFSVSTSAGSVRAVIRYNGTPAFSAGGRRLDGDGFQDQVYSPQPVVGVAFVSSAEYVYSSAALRTHFNANPAGNRSFQAPGLTADADSVSANVGDNSAGNTQFWRGTVSEVAVFSSAISAAVRKRLEQSRMRKWRIAG